MGGAALVLERVYLDAAPPCCCNSIVFQSSLFVVRLGSHLFHVDAIKTCVLRSKRSAWAQVSLHEAGSMHRESQPCPSTASFSSTCFFRSAFFALRLGSHLFHIDA